MWNFVTVLFVILAVLVATGPPIYMLIHSFRHGHIASHPDGAPPPRSDPQKFGWTVCSHCSAVVVDHTEHMRAVHQYAEA
jgi:hypothetical protein